MSHVNPEKAVANQMLEKMDMGAMMGGMAPMKMEGMMPIMKEGMASMMGGMVPMKMEGMMPMLKMPGAATGVIIYTGSGKSAIGKILTHPVVAFGLGVAVGYYVYKYRKTIISACVKPKQE